MKDATFRVGDINGQWYDIRKDDIAILISRDSKYAHWVWWVLALVLFIPAILILIFCRQPIWTVSLNSPDRDLGYLVLTECQWNKLNSNLKVY